MQTKDRAASRTVTMCVSYLGNGGGRVSLGTNSQSHGTQVKVEASPLKNFSFCPFQSQGIFFIH